MKQIKIVDPGTIYDEIDKHLAKLVREQRTILGSLTRFNFKLCSGHFIASLPLAADYWRLCQNYREKTKEIFDYKNKKH